MCTRDMSLLLLLFLLTTISMVSAVRDDNGQEGKDQRQKKLFPIFQIVTFKNDVCAATSSRNGTCYTAAECTSKGGVSSGNCASGYGVCCVFTLACGSTTSQNCSYLVQTSITAAPTTNPCTYTICRCSTNICRIRLDFTMFTIASPQIGTTAAVASVLTGGGVGDCITDSFSLSSPGKIGSPVICGFNTGQHMIVDASESCSIANFDIGSSGDTRQWDIKVTQYACGDTDGGPPGCLQYFTGSTGKIASFNFPTTSTTVGATTTHLSSQCYTMCFRQEAKKCTLCFATVIPGTAAVIDQGSFGLSVGGGTIAITASSNVDSGCTSDFLIIPNGLSAPGIATTTPRQRFCGRFLNIADQLTASATICTMTDPFRIQFKTDADETNPAGSSAAAITNELAFAPGGIVGFYLAYSQIDCI